MGGRGGSSHAGGGGGSAVTTAAAAFDRNRYGFDFAEAYEFLHGAYGDTHAQNIMALLMKAPAHIQALWIKYADRFAAAPLRPTDAKHRAYYAPSDHAVHLDIEYVSKGDSISTPYETIFHEYGHMADAIAYRYSPQARGWYGNYSNLYKNGLLGKTLKDEVESHFQRAEKELRATWGDDWIDKYYNRSDYAQYIITEVKGKFTLLDRANISDMFEGGGIDVGYPMGVGHGLDYWNGVSVAVESFAEMIDAEVANPGAIKAIKAYFPKSYKVYMEMIKEMTKR